MNGSVFHRSLCAFKQFQPGGCFLGQGETTNMGHQAGVELLEALQQELTPGVPPVPMLPSDSALPTIQLAIAATRQKEKVMK